METANNENVKHMRLWRTLGWHAGSRNYDILIQKHTKYTFSCLFVYDFNSNSLKYVYSLKIITENIILSRNSFNTFLNRYYETFFILLQILTFGHFKIRRFCQNESKNLSLFLFFLKNVTEIILKYGLKVGSKVKRGSRSKILWEQLY